MVCSIFLPIFQILVIETDLVLTLIYRGFIDPFPFFTIFGWNFHSTFELDDFESTNVLEIYLSLFVLTNF